MKRSINHLFKYFTRHKIPTKILSLFLSVLMLFYVIPTVIYGEIADALDGKTDSSDSAENGQSANSNPPDYTYQSDVYEVEELREENVKHFRLEDGSYVAAQYAYPVHYLDESGKLVDIDNSLAEASGGVYANPTARIKFAKKITGNESLFTLHDGNTKLTFSLVGANKKTVGAVTNGSDTESDTKLQKMMHLEKLSATILYEDILDGVDLEYIADSLNVKENIIVKERSDSYTYTFEIKLIGLTAELCASGDIEITDTKTGEPKYTIPAPVVFDAEGTYAPGAAAAYTLTDGGNGKYTLTVTVSPEWMNAEERAFPVTVDPTVIELDKISYMDVTVDQSNPNVADNDVYLTVSSEFHSYLKVKYLPELHSSAYITHANLNLCSVYSDYEENIGVYEVLSNWSETLTWNDTDEYGVVSLAPVDYQVVSEHPPRYYTWDITTLARKWYKGTNYGVRFSYMFPSSGYTCFLSSDNEGGAIPIFTVSYVDMKGVEDYWTFLTQDIGSAGIGNVNIANGQLTFSVPTLTTTDSLMPYTPTLIYNSSLSNAFFTSGNTNTFYEQAFLAYGFSMNTCETVIEKTYIDTDGQEKTYYVYTDAEGTEHAFYQKHPETSSHDYIDEDGLQMKMFASDNFVYITFPDLNKKMFNIISDDFDSRGYYFSSIEDQGENHLKFYKDDMYRPTYIALDPAFTTSTQEHEIISLMFSYYDNGNLRMIYNSSTNEAVVFRYSNTATGTPLPQFTKYLREISYARGNSSTTTSDWNSFAASSSYSNNIYSDALMTYSYDDDGNMCEIHNSYSNQSIKYTWENGKVSSISHYGNLSIGQTVNITYGEGYSLVQTSGNDEIINTEDDVLTTYILDDFGRTVNTYSYAQNGSKIYGAVVGEYEAQANVKNNIKEQTTTGGSPVNYLLNGNFEINPSGSNFTYWEKSGSVSGASDNYFSNIGTRCLNFYPSAGSTASTNQKLFLLAGDYTLSFPIASVRCGNVDGFVKITSANGLNHNAEIPLNKGDVGTLISNMVTSFTVENNVNGGDNITISIEFTADSTDSSSPSIYIDNVMLEEGIGASEYSLINYGSSVPTVKNSAGNTVSMSNFWETDTGNYPSIGNMSAPFGDAIKVSHKSGAESYVKQRVYQISSREITNYENLNITNAVGKYIVSGYALANDALLSDVGIFRIRVDLLYYQGENEDDVVISKYFDFDPNIKFIQFTAGVVDLKHEKESGDTKKYDRLEAIDIYLEYSGQFYGYGLFDNISFVACDENNHTRNYYNEDGLVSRIVRDSYEEYYFYDERGEEIEYIANNRGKLVSYLYYPNNFVSYEMIYSFTWNGGIAFPYGIEDPRSFIQEYLESEIYYEYNEYGLLTEKIVRNMNIDENTPVSETKDYAVFYEYDTTLGSNNFGALISEEDSRGTKYVYFYNNKGLLVASLNATNGKGTAYLYDPLHRLQAVRPATYSESNNSYSVTSGAETVYYHYDNYGNLDEIGTNTTVYELNYNVYGNISGISSGSNEIVEYTYNSRNGKINSVTYENYFREDYVYNELEFLEEVWYNDYNNGGGRFLAYKYEYTAYGDIYKIQDFVSGITTIYNYDSNRRLISFYEYENDELKYSFNASVKYDYLTGQVKSLLYKVGYNSGDVYKYSNFQYLNLYLHDGKLNYYNVMTPAANVDISHSYNYLDMITSAVAVYKNSSNLPLFTHESAYEYDYDYNHNYGIVEKHTSTFNDRTTEYTYTYDADYNITKILSTGYVRYYYDNVGKLIREENIQLGETYVYSYDDAGNITSKTTYDLPVTGITNSTPKSIKNYVYSNGDWGDLLISYNGSTITYDTVGNPLTYNNGAAYTFSWTGRRLTGATKGGVTYSYTYNDEGIRTSKTRYGHTTTYHLSGDKIMAEETNGNITVYLYDESGSPMGMQYHGASYANNQWDVYWFEKNLLGDIVAVYDKDGYLAITYTYDAWGNFEEEFNHSTFEMSPAANNPFRYRGYYYDTDLELYYLNSRYYDSKIGRFISADDLSYLGANGDLNSYNLYAYCSNNPVMYTDPNGEFAIPFGVTLCFLTICCAAFGAGMDIVSQLSKNNGNINDIDWGSVINSACVGAALGFSNTMGVTYLGPILAGAGTISAGTAIGVFAASVGVSAAAGGGGYLLQECINGCFDDTTLTKATGHAVVVAVEGAYCFCVGGMVGSVGDVGTKGNIFKKERFYKFVLGQEYSFPFKYLLDKLRKGVLQ